MIVATRLEVRFATAQSLPMSRARFAYGGFFYEAAQAALRWMSLHACEQQLALAAHGRHYRSAGHSDRENCFGERLKTAALTPRHARQTQ